MVALRNRLLALLALLARGPLVAAVQVFLLCSSASLFGGGRLLLLVVLLLRLGVVSGVKRDLEIDLQGAKESY